MRIGVLSVQGAFMEHENMLRFLGCETVELRKKQDIRGLDGIILPGGESTVQGKLLRDLDMFCDLRELICDGMPVMGTCAGLILLGGSIVNDDRKHFATLPVAVKRNAYGRQLGSFTTVSSFGEIRDFEMTFIRAPCITDVQEGVEVLAEVDGRIVGVRYGNQVGLAFHPELGGDSRIHEYFLDLIRYPEAADMQLAGWPQLSDAPGVS